MRIYLPLLQHVNPSCCCESPQGCHHVPRGRDMGASQPPEPPPLGQGHHRHGAQDPSSGPRTSFPSNTAHFLKKAKGSQQLGKHFLTLQASTPAVTPSHLPGGFLSDHVAACPQSPAKSVGNLSSSPGGHDGALHAPGNPSSMKANLKGARVSCVQRHGARKKHDRFGYIFTELLSTGD